MVDALAAMPLLWAATHGGAWAGDCAARDDPACIATEMVACVRLLRLFSFARNYTASQARLQPRITFWQEGDRRKP